MMSASENTALGRRAWEAISDSDLDALRRLWSEKLVWHAAGGHPWSGHFEGRDAVIEHLAQIGDSVEQFDANLDEILSSATRIIYAFHVLARRGERRVRVDYLMLARVEDEQFVSVWLSPLNPEAHEELWRDFPD